MSSSAVATDAASGSPALSVVVCCRHDSLAEVEACLSSLSRSLSAADEVLFVLDYVDDARESAIRALVCDPRIHVICNEASQGKKGAQRTGVYAAKSEYIVSVDADCQVSPSFIDAVRTSCPVSPTPFMLLLPVFMRGTDNLFGQMVELEFVCLQMVTAGTALMGYPTMANGAGMVFSRRMYCEHDSQSEFVSGDDMFLLQHAIAVGAPVSFLCRSEAVVSTDAPATLSAYLRQRTRWLSKAGGYTSWSVRLLAIVVFVANVEWVLLLPFFSVASLLLFSLKLLTDASVFAAGRRLWPSKVNICVSVLLEILYPLMMLTIAFRSLFASRRSW